MSSKCRAVVFNGDGTYNIKTFDKPLPPAGGAVLKVEAVGMCSSDVGQLEGYKHVPGEVAPIVPGHEIVGRVEALAEDADLNVSVGERVAVDLLNRSAVYKDRLVIYGYTLGVDDECGLWGGYGEYMCLMAGTKLMKLTESLPAEHLTIFEPLANAISWTDQAGIRPGQTVVILGPGHIGLMCVVAAKIAGAANIIVTGTSVDKIRLDAALKSGANHIIDVDTEDAVARVSQITKGRKANVVMDVTALSTRAVEQAFDMVSFGGTVMLAGLKDSAPVELVTDKIVLKALTVRGCAGSTEEAMDRAVSLLNERQVPTDVLLGEVFSLDQIEEAITLLKREHQERDAVRVTLKHC